MGRLHLGAVLTLVGLVAFCVGVCLGAVALFGAVGLACALVLLGVGSCAAGLLVDFERGS